MIAEIPEYVDPQVREKITRIFEMMRDNIPGEVEELFVSIAPNASGPGSITLWAFTDLHVVRVWDPINEDRIQHEIAYVARCVDWVELDARKFNFGTPDRNSRLRLEFTTTDGLSGELWGEGEGCTHLMTIYKERFLRNFYPPEVNTVEWYRRS